MLVSRLTLVTTVCVQVYHYTTEEYVELGQALEVKKIESNGRLKLRKLKVTAIAYFCLPLGFARSTTASGSTHEPS